MLALGGGAGEIKRLKKVATEIGFKEGEVLFLGALSRNEVLSWLRRCTVFVLPSKFETFGCVLVEALFCGKPVVATNCGGPSEIVSEGLGILVENGCTAMDLAYAIEDALERKRLLGSAEIRRIAVSKFGRLAVSQILINFYCSFLIGLTKPGSKIGYDLVGGTRQNESS